MTKQTRRPWRPKEDLPAFVDALEKASPDSPACRDRPAEFVDYEEGFEPSEDGADDLCIECPLMALCLQNAKHRKPVWGVWGGVVWLDGKPLDRSVSPEEIA